MGQEHVVDSWEKAHSPKPIEIVRVRPLITIRTAIAYENRRHILNHHINLSIK